MTITYPLTMPDQNFTTTQSSSFAAVGVSSNGYTFQRQVQVFSGKFWSFDITVQTKLNDANGRAWLAFLHALNGQEGTFYMGLPGLTRISTAGGTPLVRGAGQSGSALITDGWDSSATNVMLAGDFFSIDHRLYLNLTTVNADSSGIATLDIWPHLRTTHADNSPLELSNPQGIFHLNGNNISWTQHTDNSLDVAFTAVEHIT